MASVPTGTKLGKYEVMKPLAGGGMAELLLARTAPTERPLVLKWIRPEQAIDGTFVETFVAEGRRAAQLHHPNIVEVHEVGREDGTHYLAMEYVHGDDLRKLLARLCERRAKLPVQHILAIATSVAQALQHAHEQTGAEPVLHLGIKPGNVLITADGAVKLADFGIGRAALTDGRTDLLASIVGYLSPEQCTGQPVDRRSDVFGLGILLYELSTGRRLFKGENEFVTMATIVAGDIPLPTKHRGDLPKELEVVIMKALARAPEDRFQSAHELHTALEKFATKAGVRGSLTTLAGYTKRLFGVRPEPWLVDETGELATPNDFDGSPRGLATPPVEATKGCNLPDHVTTTDDAPIMRVKKQVSRDLPTEQLNLASLRATVPDKSTPVKIPAGNGARAAPKPLPSRPTPVPIAAARTKPKTVQIPVAAADKIVKDESTKVASPGTDDANTNVVVDLEEVTKESGPAVPMDAMTPTRPVDPNAKPKVSAPKGKKVPAVFTEDTVPAAPASGVNGKPALVSLTGLEKADAQREAAKKAKKAAEDAARLPKASAAGEIKPRNDATEKERTDTDIDELVIESTEVSNPPPMPAVVVSTSVARDATEHVQPLPSPNDQTITRTDSVITGNGSKKWFVIGGLAIAAAAALVIAIGFTGGDAGDDPPQPSANEQPAPVAADREPDEPETKPAPQPEEGLRTSSAPRTPRNSHVTVDDQAKPPEEVKPEEAQPIEPAPVEPAESVAAVPPPVEVKPPPVEVKPPPVEVKPVEAKPESKPEAKKPKVEDPPPPKFEEPKDPSPPDEEVVTKSTKKPKATATKPKPKPAVAAKQKPTKPKPKPKAGNWDPNALFPK